MFDRSEALPLAPLALVLLRKAEIILALDRGACVLLLRPIIFLSLLFGGWRAGAVLRERSGPLFGFAIFAHQNSPVFFFAGLRSGNARGACEASSLRPTFLSYGPLRSRCRP